LNGHGVEFLIVGAYALAFHGAPRFTGDLDLFVRPTPDNAAKVLDAVRAFGFPIEELQPRDLTDPRRILEMGTEPVQIHVMSAISGVSWEDAWRTRAAGMCGRHAVSFLGRLVVCGFAFDPHVSEEAKRYGKLTVLAARMNPDLSMGDELLKKTGAANLFMVFGEPDIKITPDGDEGYLVVEVRGVDVYDPTTGQIRSSSTDDIACWFIDTDYNGESFFVRHAYFTGGDEPYEKLKRALRAEIDEGAWSTLYSTVSRPFAPPETRKIAVKVINHYGDEVLKVFDVA
jgi:hypothetical protein